MAYIGDVGTRGKVLRLGTSDTGIHHLGNASDAYAGQICIQVVITGSGGSFVVKQRVTGSELTGTNYQPCVIYESDQTTAIASSTAISTAGIYYIISDGCDTVLDYTASTGNMDIYISRFIG